MKCFYEIIRIIFQLLKTPKYWPHSVTLWEPHFFCFLF